MVGLDRKHLISYQTRNSHVWPGYAQVPRQYSPKRPFKGTQLAGHPARRASRRWKGTRNIYECQGASSLQKALESQGSALKRAAWRLPVCPAWLGAHNQGAFTRHTWSPMTWTWALAVRGRQGAATAVFNALNTWGGGRQHKELCWWSMSEAILSISPSRSPASHLLQFTSTAITSVQQGFEVLGSVLL